MPNTLCDRTSKELVLKKNACILLAQLPHVRTQMLDASNLHPLKEGKFTHALSAFMIQLAPDPLASIKELLCITTPGGVLSLEM